MQRREVFFGIGTGCWAFRFERAATRAVAGGGALWLDIFPFRSLLFGRASTVRASSLARAWRSILNLLFKPARLPAHAAELRIGGTWRMPPRAGIDSCRCPKSI